MTANRNEMYAARCGDCHWFRNTDANEFMGDCFLYPPTVLMTPNMEVSMSDDAEWSTNAPDIYHSEREQN